MIFYKLCIGDTTSVVLQTCFSWRTNGQDVDCDESGAYPGGPSKCDCAALDLGITIIGPSEAPSISTQTTNMPSYQPSVSSKPSDHPSFSPSLSAAPSSQPTQNPSISTMPTTLPSHQPSISKVPSLAPSFSPSVSTMPSTMPSYRPSQSSVPSLQPSPIPSISIKPTLKDSYSPSISTQPTDQPSNEPSISKAPTKVPSYQPSLSTSPSSSPTMFPSVSLMPSGIPSDSPTISTAPSTHPTSEPSESPSSSPTLLGSIGGVIFEDKNNNGLMDSNEVGLSGILVLLYDDVGTGTQETVSDSNGNYLFEDVFPGEHTVGAVSPGDEYNFSPVVDGGNQLSPYGTMSNMGLSQPFTLTEGDLIDDIDGGLYQASTIKGIVWHDLNANGIREVDEPGIEGATVTISNGNGEEFSGTTDIFGQYAVTDLKPGTYSSTFLPSGDFFLSPVNVGSSEMIDSDFMTDGLSSTGITLESGDVSSGMFDAGIWMYSSVGDFLWYDTNADGIQNEDPIVGFPFPVTINLYDTNGQLLSSTQNDEYGFYQFYDIMPGDYKLEYVIDETETFSPPFQGTSDVLDSNVDPESGRTSVSLDSGEMNTSTDVGIIGEAPYYPDWVFEEQICTVSSIDCAV